MPFASSPGVSRPRSAAAGRCRRASTRRLSAPAALVGVLVLGQVLLGPVLFGLGGGVARAQTSPWYVDELRLADVHRLSTGTGVVVAVVDGGVDATHPALAGQLLPGIGLGADAAPDGQRDDDPDGHGTSMAGIIAARPTGPDGAPTGFLGVAPDAKILPVSTGVETDTVEVAQAIRLATDRGAKVISLSLGSTGSASVGERSAVRYALSRDVVVVAAAGNVESDDSPPEAYEINSPANIPGVIAVTGSNPRGELWVGSAYGPRAVLAAPGASIRSPVPAELSPVGAATSDGTSNSTAIVSGVVALVRARYPDLSAPSVIDLLIRTADDKGPPGRDEKFGFGIVDPLAALTATPDRVAVNPLLAEPGAQAGNPLPADEDALLRAGGDAPDGGTSGGSPPASPAAPGPTDVVVPPAGDEEDGPGALAWVGGITAAVLVGIGLGAGAFAASRALRRPAGAGAGALASPEADRGAPGGPLTPPRAPAAPPASPAPPPPGAMPSGAPASGAPASGVAAPAGDHGRRGVGSMGE
ncbi:S8 family serine peptidase [Frankia sp. CNm7]|uniref:S8 family serine peptidase n=1 Tax=Frankia nepalensis TaxID=1836974 RepID=A0A937RX80_9ACTN|nr:S8 family serine peptidase [Frankia nepalensis]MBL7495992.1 S8 family serine peptidase [Frankia nepalensis]MBL7514964.1 S8 family serine peptidase [Frankia nepalensis]MBL7523623.1 S8 family serine peptidase [Frankia nepalensis]MBL7633461.1 S8 family serine peptidase [Frankia nepalensis]